MKANELMIGDWFQTIYPTGKVEFRKVEGVMQNHIVCNNGVTNAIEPIPLTVEILEKNGLKPFKIDKLTEQATAKWWAKGGDYYVKQYNFKHNDFLPTYSFGCHPHTLIERLRYVHELQHALKLCGIDKEIVL